MHGLYGAAERVRRLFTAKVCAIWRTLWRMDQGRSRRERPTVGKPRSIEDARVEAGLLLTLRRRLDGSLRRRLALHHVGGVGLVYHQVGAGRIDLAAARRQPVGQLRPK